MRRQAERFQEAQFELIVVGGGMSGLCAALASARHGVKTALVNTINVYDILNGGKFVCTADAIKRIEEVYA